MAVRADEALSLQIFLLVQELESARGMSVWECPILQEWKKWHQMSADFCDWEGKQKKKMKG